MNLLAHAHLADDAPEALLGNLVADFLKPFDLEHLPEGIRSGVRSHRQIDAFTDRHPVVHRSIRRIGDSWGWFSGILIDVYYDHILATTWERYSSQPLSHFVQYVHDVIAVHSVRLPEETRRIIQSFVETNRLMSYAVPDGSGIEDALARLSERIALRIPKRARRLDQAMPLLRTVHAELVEDFHEFYPTLWHYMKHDRRE